MTPTDKDKILDQLFKFDKGVLRKTEQVFGSIQSLIDAYSNVEEEEFDRHHLQKYSLRFYKSLRDLRIVGANAIDDSGIIERQRLIGKTLRDELLPTRVPIVKEAATNDYSQGSQRTYYSFGIQDGLNWVFLREHIERGKSVQESVNAIGGESNSKGNKRAIDRSLEKVKIDQTLTTITPWDPAKHYHEIPTLILDGELDPVTAGEQAERYFKFGLRGPRTLIRFPSIGHAISLGAIFTTFDDQPPILSGAIRVALPKIGPGESIETKGMATGLELNPNLRVDLDEPEELKEAITIQACGILQDGDVEKNGQSNDLNLNIVALIENRSERDISVKDHKWLLHTPLLWGTVEFVKPETIAKKAKCAVFGRLVHGQRNQDKRYRVEPLFSLKEIEPHLKFVGFNLNEGGSVEMWFQSEDITNLVVRQWVIQNSECRFAFRVDVPELKKNEIKSLSVGVDGLNLDTTEVLTIHPPDELAGKLAACFDNQAGNSHRVSFIVWNKENKRHRIDKPWGISCPVFSATVVPDPGEIGPNTLKKVTGNVKGINWVKSLCVTPPSGWNSELRLISFNILDRNSVSMLFRNTGDGSITPAARDWNYVVPTVNPNETDLDRALNCLIFSFLVLNPSQFFIPEDNEALKRIEDCFKKLSLEIKPLHESGGVAEL
jgi:hypothetical protein